MLSEFNSLISMVDRFHGRDPRNYNEGTHLITGKGATRYQVGPKDF